MKAIWQWLFRGWIAEEVRAEVDNCDRATSSLIQQRRQLRGELDTKETLIIQLHSALHEATKPFAPVDSGTQPPWTPADAEAWRRFLRSEHGQALAILANWQEQAANRTVILQKTNLENAAGFARGWHQASAYFFKALTADVRPEQDNAKEQGQNEANPLLERLAP
jgi:hypothetical protein